MDVMDVTAQWMPDVRTASGPGVERLPGAAPRCAVLGIGNPLMADDGLGIHVVQALRSAADGFGPATERVDVIDGGTLGYLLIDRLAGYDALIAVDAANLKEAPGTVRVLSGAALEDFLADRSATSVHEVSLIDLLQMLQLCNEAPRSFALVGVQPALIDWATELTPAVAASVAAATGEVRRLVSAWDGGGRLD